MFMKVFFSFSMTDGIMPVAEIMNSLMNLRVQEGYQKQDKGKISHDHSGAKVITQTLIPSTKL